MSKIPLEVRVIALGLLNAVLMSAGIFFQKLNSVRGGNIYLSVLLVCAFIAYGPTFWIGNHVYSIGGRVSLFVPMSAAMYVLTMALGRFYFQEPVSGGAWVGAGLVVAGVALIARG